MVNRTVRIWDEDIAARTGLDPQNKTTGPGSQNRITRAGHSYPLSKVSILVVLAKANISITYFSPLIRLFLQVHYFSGLAKVRSQTSASGNQLTINPLIH
jgi:hypothetical protein